MRTLSFSAAILAIATGASAAPQSQPAPTPMGSEMHVTVPSLPGQPNKSGTVRPDGGMPMDSEGYAVTKRYDPSNPSAGSKPGPDGNVPPTGGGAAAGGAAYVPPPMGPAPSGKATVTGANHITIRGTIKTVDANKSVTVKVQKTGATLTYTLASNAEVPADLKPGESVRLRAYTSKKGGRFTDKIERVTATATK